MSGSLEEALAPFLIALQADGYEGSVEERDDTLVFEIKAGPDACEECLSPREVMEPMVLRVLREAGFGQRLEIRYPASHVSH